MPSPRPVMDAERKAAYIDALKSGLRKGDAAKAIGVARGTVWKAAEEDEEFRARIEEAAEEAVEAVEDALYEAALSGNVVAIQVVLYNRAPGRWADRRQLHAKVSGHDGGPIRIVQWKDLLLEQEGGTKAKPESGTGSGG